MNATITIDDLNKNEYKPKVTINKTGSFTSTFKTIVNEVLSYKKENKNNHVKVKKTSVEKFNKEQEVLNDYSVYNRIKTWFNNALTKVIGNWEEKIKTNNPIKNTIKTLKNKISNSWNADKNEDLNLQKKLFLLRKLEEEELFLKNKVQKKPFEWATLISQKNDVINEEDKRARITFVYRIWNIDFNIILERSEKYINLYSEWNWANWVKKRSPVVSLDEMSTIKDNKEKNVLLKNNVNNLLHYMDTIFELGKNDKKVKNYQLIA